MIQNLMNHHLLREDQPPLRCGGILRDNQHKQISWLNQTVKESAGTDFRLAQLSDQILQFPDVPACFRADCKLRVRYSPPLRLPANLRQDFCCSR